MKKNTLISPLFAAILLLMLPNLAKAQSYEYNLLISQTISGNDLLVTLSIENLGSPFYMATSTFGIEANSTALNLDAATLETSGAWGLNMPHYSAQTATGNDSAGTVQTTVNYFGPTSNQGGVVLPANTTLLIGVIRIPIDVPSSDSEVEWDQSNTDVVRVNWTTTRPSTASHQNISSGATFIDPPNFTLPVELISFTAKGYANNVVINWATASEKNNSHFDIERSSNGNEWLAVGTVEGNGNTTARQNYSFTDYNIYKGSGTQTVYYRLRQADYDGAYEYSPVTVVTFNGERSNLPTTLTLSPNPATDRTEIAVKGFNGRFNATFFNATGQQVGIFQGNGSQLVVPVSNLTGGVYIIRITSAAGELIGTQRLVVNN